MFFEAAKSGLVLCCVGFSPDIEGEEGDAIESAHKGERDRIEFQDCHVEFLQQPSARLKEEGSKTKVVVILFGGSAIFRPAVASSSAADRQMEKSIT